MVKNINVGATEASTQQMLNSEHEVDWYINAHRDWWSIAKLQNFVDRIPILVKDNKLRFYFSLAVGKLRNKIKDEQLWKEVERAGHLRSRKKNTIEDGDVFGPPRFFRFGDGGHSKKKNNTHGFYMGDEGRIVDEQYRKAHPRSKL